MVRYNLNPYNSKYVPVPYTGGTTEKCGHTHSQHRKNKNNKSNKTKKTYAGGDKTTKKLVNLLNKSCIR